jgi:hypothetical protein
VRFAIAGTYSATRIAALNPELALHSCSGSHDSIAQIPMQETAKPLPCKVWGVIRRRRRGVDGARGRGDGSDPYPPPSEMDVERAVEKLQQVRLNRNFKADNARHYGK